jgi:hypothetical protein
MISSLLRLFLCCLLFTFTTSPKLLAQPPERSRSGDFDQDGRVDTLRWQYDGGSSFGGYEIDLIDGFSGGTLFYTMGVGSSAQIIYPSLIPKPNNSPNSATSMKPPKTCISTPRQGLCKQIILMAP